MVSKKSLCWVFVTGVACGSTFGTAACSSGPAEPGTAPSSAASKYSGVDVLKGVFFREGPFADANSDLWSVAAEGAPKSPEEAIAALEHAIDRMKAEGWSPATIARAQAALDAYRAGTTPPQAAPEDVAVARELLLARLAESDPTFFDRFGAEMQSGDRLRVEAALADAAPRVEAAAHSFGDGPSPYELTQRCLVVDTYLILTFARVINVDDGNSRLGHAEKIDQLTARLAP